MANTWARNKDVQLSVGGDMIASGSFYYKSGYTTYEVTYRNAGNGVIAYDYAIADFDYQAATMNALVACVAAIAAVVTGLPVETLMPGR